MLVVKVIDNSTDETSDIKNKIDPWVWINLLECTRKVKKKLKLGRYLDAQNWLNKSYFFLFRAIQVIQKLELVLEPITLCRKLSF